MVVPKAKAASRGTAFMPFCLLVLILGVALVVANFASLGDPMNIAVSIGGIETLRKSIDAFNKPNYIPKSYSPSKIEKYFLDHGIELGLDNQENPSSGCSKWTDPNSPLAAEFDAFRQGMKNYKEKLQDMLASKDRVKDLRKEIAATGDHSVCDTLELHPDGLNGLFPLQTLTQTSNSLLEPLFPPLRNPEICWDSSLLLSLDYLIHDFAAYCRMLTPSSRIVLIDMGASLSFHDSGETPAVYMTEMFGKAGFQFDHIYAYEVTATDPKEVVEKVPEELAPAYHWINVPVDPDVNSKQNPFRMLQQAYDENDFVIVKLDIDTPSVEMPMVQHLLDSPELQKLVDVFYFEHHVFLEEMAYWWGMGNGMKGSVLDSLQLFATLREKGIDAHSWV